MHSSPVDQLREHGLSVTAQRLAILQAVTSQPHATADQISDLAVAALGTISRQSVYDSLNTLVNKGVLRRIQPMGSPALYEDRVDDNHHHLICRECGQVVDVDCAAGKRPCLDAADDHGFAIDEAEVAYWGRCQQCQQTDALTSRSATQVSRSNQ